MTNASVDLVVDKNDAKPPKGAAKRGAPIGNTNAIRHGLTIGKLPKGAAYVARCTAEFRVALEDAVIDAKGEVSLYDSALIQTAIRHERHALLCQRWLRLSLDDLSPDQRLAFSREIGRASAARDQSLKALQLDRDSRANIFDGLYAAAHDVDAGQDDDRPDDQDDNDQDDAESGEDRDDGMTIDAPAATDEQTAAATADNDAAQDATSDYQDAAAPAQADALTDDGTQPARNDADDAREPALAQDATSPPEDATALAVARVERLPANTEQTQEEPTP